MLEICQFFFEHLHSQNIRYCHWKSNGHLHEALTGKTDLDILVHIEDESKLNQALKSFNFLEIISPPLKRFPYLEDYLGFDDQTGRLIHLHVHYKLILGQRYIKNHHLPLEDLFFDNLTTKDNIYVPKPELELLLLVIRAGMKVENIALLKHAIKGFTDPIYTAFPAGIEQEFHELIPASDINTLLELLQQSQLPIKAEIFTTFIDKFQNQSLKFYDIFSLNREVLKSLRGFQRNKSPMAIFRYYWLIISNLNVVTKFFPTKKKRMANLGFSFSIVGADGSGKSTLTKDLHNWLSWKLYTNFYYYGIPKTFVVRLINLIGRGLGKLKLPFLQSITDSFLWIYIARKRYMISQQIKTDVAKGVVVITDRFPLKSFHSMNQPMDGPRISGINRKMCRFSKIEENYYNKISPPDRIFVLQVTLDELRKRKTDLDLSTHKQKTDAVNAIVETDKIIVINANKPYSEVCLCVKRNIWRLLTTFNQPQNITF